MVHPCCNVLPTSQAARFIALCDLVFGLIGVFWFVYILEGYGYIDKEELYDYLYETDTFMPPSRIRLVNQSGPSIFPDFNKSAPIVSPPAQSITLNLTNANGTSSTSPPPEVMNIHYYSIFTVSPNGIGIDGELGNICLSGFYTAMNIALFVLLLRAINKRCIIKLTIWFWLRVSILLMKAILYTTYIALGLSIWFQTPHTIFMFVHAYGLWIVGTLIKEIKEERKNVATGPSTIQGELKSVAEEEGEPGNASK